MNRRGQGSVEYLLAFAALLVVLVVIGHFIAAAKRSSVRTVRLVSSELP